LRKAADNSKIDVLNALGQLIFSKDISHKLSVTIDLTRNGKGLYFIKVQSGNTVVVRKVIVE